MLRQGDLSKIATIAQAAAEADHGDGVWFRMEKTVDLETQGEYGGLRLVLRAGIGEVLANLKKAQTINLDIGKGDPVVPGPVEIETPFLLGGGKLSWRVYPVALATKCRESSRKKSNGSLIPGSARLKSF